MTQPQLADHIEGPHHAYLKTELPRLVEMADRVASKHCWRDARLESMASTVGELAAEMMCHMQKEETILFPLVRAIDAGSTRSAAELTATIRQREAEHEGAGQLTAKLRKFTDGFAPNAEACNTYRARLEGDLHRHVHKENNILFPRALERVAAGL